MSNSLGPEVCRRRTTASDRTHFPRPGAEPVTYPQRHDHEVKRAGCPEGKLVVLGCGFADFPSPGAQKGGQQPLQTGAGQGQQGESRGLELGTWLCPSCPRDNKRKGGQGQRQWQRSGHAGPPNWQSLEIQETLNKQ